MLACLHIALSLPRVERNVPLGALSNAARRGYRPGGADNSQGAYGGRGGRGGYGDRPNYGGGRGGYGGAQRYQGHGRPDGRFAPRPQRTTYQWDEPARSSELGGFDDYGSEGAAADDLDFLYGVNPVLAALKQRRRSVERLLLQETMDLSKRKDASALREITSICEASGIAVERVDKGYLNRKCDNRPHQGVVLMGEPLLFEHISNPPLASPDALGQRRLWLVLDEVQDPHNLGSLLRSAYFLGVDGVLVSEKNTARLSPAVSKSSAGAMELMRVHSTRNLVKYLSAATEAGWLVAGAAFDDSVLVGELEGDDRRPTMLVMGSEGKGLRTMVSRSCEVLVRVPRGLGGDGGGTRAMTQFDGIEGLEDHSRLVDSLNVGVAGALLMHQLLGR